MEHAATISPLALASDCRYLDHPATSDVVRRAGCARIHWRKMVSQPSLNNWTQYFRQYS
jgi:hypothetical protein